MDEKSFTIHIPATTANLGPGFDCLGLALDLWNKITFSIDDAPFTINIEGEGKGYLPEDKTNLIFESAKQLAKIKGMKLPDNLHICCQNKIPVASGLGSSAGAVISGLIGAKKILEIDLNDHELLQIAAQIEGHADNAAACIFGGLVMVRQEKDIFHISNPDIQPITAVVAIPEYPLSTKIARGVLPEQVNMEDAVFNISHTVELVQVFLQGNYSSLKETMTDKLHQVYRLPLLPGAEYAMQAALDIGAYGACLSGAGPSVIAFTNQRLSQGVGDAMRAAYQQKSISARVISLGCPAKGMFSI